MRKLLIAILLIAFGITGVVATTDWKLVEQTYETIKKKALFEKNILKQKPLEFPKNDGGP